MTAWNVRMSIVVDDERWDVLEVQHQLMKAVAIVDARPRFLTAQNWMVEATEDLKYQPEPSGRVSGYVAEHAGTIRRSGGMPRD